MLTMNTLLTARRAALFAALALTLLLSACAPHQYTGLIFQDDNPAADIVGIDYNGEPYQLSDHRGELSIVFFGYTFCPDICPMTLANMSQVYTIIEDESPELVEDLNMVFVSVDPERDTPERIAQYVPLFNPTFHGLYIPADQLEPIKSAYGIYAEKNTEVEGKTAAEYLIDHTAGIYVVDRDGNLRALFKHDMDPQLVAADVKELLKLR